MSSDNGMKIYKFIFDLLVGKPYRKPNKTNPLSNFEMLVKVTT